MSLRVCSLKIHKIATAIYFVLPRHSGRCVDAILRTGSEVMAPKCIPANSTFKSVICVIFAVEDLIMAEDLQIAAGTKQEQYEALLPQLKGLLEGEDDLTANLANVAAALKEQFGWLWVGFYIVKGDELVLGPFQGPVACTRIRKGRGVCGAAWQQAETVIVPDVEAFPGHIACSSLSRSEIVVPVIKDGAVVAVLDADSMALNTYDETDRQYLEAIVRLIHF
jgi:L-methionine (R)-S-oxide reductase